MNLASKAIVTFEFEVVVWYIKKLYRLQILNNLYITWRRYEYKKSDFEGLPS